ncbi:MAG: helix-hairpin-helix domain-containing protein, partial [Thermoanaerobaculia bacterium]
LKRRCNARPTPLPHERDKAIEDAWKRLLSISIEGEMRAELKQRADTQAIDVFGQNLRNLLLAPPAGSRRVLALDPGLRTGIKVAMLDETGKLLETTTLYTERSANERANAQRALQRLVETHKPNLLAVGNGTGSREAENFVRASVSGIPIVSVSEQGASIYSASEVAREEFPDLDVSLRSAVSIGRRLQDPLGELVKIDPKSIGVGQYQHDVNQTFLKKKLGETVDWCVNLVGVDVNTASPQLLEHVSGIGPVLAKRIVEHRNEHGSFVARQTLLDVRGLGARAFEQCAGFLRIRDHHPLDNSAVHPERYALVETMAKDHGVGLQELVGNAQLADRIEWRKYVSGDVGEPTLRDIVAELKKPGRDPRGSFEPPKFRDDVQKIDDLREGMILEGVVTNVTAFGAFVDIGVHQDGLVHVSQLSNKFVRDPHDVVKVGDRVTVKVTSVEVERKRIALSMKI